jgi:hypothetical protein
VGLGLLAWALTPAAAGAMPAINSAGKASQQRQEETEQEGERGQSPLQGDCLLEYNILHDTFTKRELFIVTVGPQNFIF